MIPPRKDVCDCGVLEKSSREPVNPIRYDPELNEYYIAVGISGNMINMMVYYCPFCGGKTPESRRASLFADVSDAEAQRLCRLLAGITTEEQARNAFGTPDLEQTSRTLTYSKLSSVADVEFDIDDEAHMRAGLVPKYLRNKGSQRRL